MMWFCTCYHDINEIRDLIVDEWAKESRGNLEEAAGKVHTFQAFFLRNPPAYSTSYCFADCAVLLHIPVMGGQHP